MTRAHGRSAAQERRQHHRYQTPAASQVRFAALIEVEVKDVGLGGMCFETRERPKVGATYSVVLRLGRERLNLTGKVAWSHLAATVHLSGGDVAPVYRVGMRFSPALSPEMSGILEKLERQGFLAAAGSSSEPALS